MLAIERGCNKSQCVKNSVWKRLWTCRKTDYRMNEWMNEWTLLENSLYSTQSATAHRITQASLQSRKEGWLRKWKAAGAWSWLRAPHFFITWLLIKHRDNCTLMNVSVSVSRKTDTLRSGAEFWRGGWDVMARRCGIDARRFEAAVMSLNVGHQSPSGATRNHREKRPQ